MNPIIQDNDINEEAARNYLNDCYSGLELLPNIPEKFSRLTAATILNVSLPTIERMLKDKQIELTKHSLQNYIMQNMLVNYPIAWDVEEKMKTKTRELSPEGIEDNIQTLEAETDNGPSLFSEEDLKQEELMKKDKIMDNFHRGLVEGTLYKMHFTYFNYKGKRFRYSFDGENESLWVLDNNKWALVN